MKLVLDASVAVEIVLARDGGSALARLQSADEGTHAPDLINAEVLHAIRRYRLSGRLGEGRAQRSVDAYLDLPIARHPTSALLGRAWSLADRLTAYDAMYVALSEALDATLLTADRRLSRAAGELVDVAVV